MKLTMSKMTDRDIGNDRMLYIPLSFILPAVILIIALMVLQIVPFGDDHSLLLSDGQFAPNSLAFLNRLLHGQENILYSLKNGLGYNEWSSLSWGGMAPVSLLIAWFSTLETMPTAFTWLVVINLSLCGLAMYLLLASVRGHELSNLLFSTSYALMGYNVAYLFHLGFFIGPQLLPLVVLGILKIMRGNSPLLYIFSLAVAIFFNFYFGFMLCAASLVTFCAYLYAEAEALKGSRAAIAGKWLISSIIAGFIAAPMWLPALKAFTGGGRIDQALMFDTTFHENMPFIQIFSKLFTGANSQGQEVNGLPYIFCGIFILALVILYFTNNEIPGRRKKAAAFILGFYLLTFYIQAFTKLMHGGTHTNWFNYRYSFVFSFFLICIAAEEFKYISGITIRDAKKSGAILLISTILVFSTSYEFITGGAVVLDFAFLALIWMIIRIFQAKPQKLAQKGMAGLLLLVVTLDLFANFTISTRALQDWEKDLTLYQANVMFSGSSVDALKQYDPDFFRMENDVSESYSLGVDSLLYGYNSVGSSGPTERMFYHKQLNKLGINWYDMRHWYQKGVPAATDALLGVKYVLASRPDIGEEKDYPRIVATQENAVYLNPNALSIAVLAEGESSGLELGNNVFENLNEVWKAVSGGDKDIFSIPDDIQCTLHNAVSDTTVTTSDAKASVSKSESEEKHSDISSSNYVEEEINPDNAFVEVEFVAEVTGPVYRFDTSIPESEFGLAAINIHYRGYYKKGETVKDSIPTNSAYIPQSMFLDYCSHIAYASSDNSVIAEYAKKLNSRDITFNVEKETDLKGEFTADAGQRILFTIPWDEGWTCYIDGKQVSIDKTWGLFMSVEAPEGQHTYEMKFFPAWMNYGLYLNAAAFVGLVVLMIVWKKRRKSDPIPAPLEESNI